LAVLPHLDGFWPPTVLLTLTVPVLATVYLALGVVFVGLSTVETRGVAMGLYGVVLYTGLGAGPAIFGPVMERGGYGAGFTAWVPRCSLRSALARASGSWLTSAPV